MATDQDTVVGNSPATVENLAELFSKAGGFEGMRRQKEVSSPESEEEKKAEEITAPDAPKETEEQETPETDTEITEIESKSDTTNAVVSEEHKESSKLGRKLKGFEQKHASEVQALNAKIAALEGVITKLVPTATQAETSLAQTQVDLPEVISTPDDVYNALLANPDVLAKISTITRAKEEAEQAAYQNEFRKQYFEMDKLHPELSEDVLATFQEKFNKRLSNDPKRDAVMLYSQALAETVLKKSAVKTPALPNRKVADKPPAGPAAKDTAAQGSEKKPVIPKNLDPLTKAWVEHQYKSGKTEEEIASYFT